MLIQFNSDFNTLLQSDARDSMVAAILSKKHYDVMLKPVAFMFKKISLAGCNDNINDKELLVIIRVLEKWRSVLARLLMQDPMYVMRDYKNFEYFISTKDFNRRQAGWAEFLTVQLLD